MLVGEGSGDPVNAEQESKDTKDSDTDGSGESDGEGEEVLASIRDETKAKQESEM